MLTDVMNLRIGDRITYSGVVCTILADREPHTDVTGLPVGRWLAQRADTSAFGFLVFGDGATVEQCM